ncbi:DUF6122 family protein [Robiginitalea sp. SC105]|uniref:DUF6122 family protein n=1 Tax=Robiginitalea sp. SC105 TaxID=2762332 RepID=UPI001639C5DF|nr:DUF6122 family protein [Robiginitalea sp. SC105]MBC2839236.1 hypothetical protein [Robiginitalea sp. SC105]
MREAVHYGLHFGLPILVAFGWYPRKSWLVLGILLAGLLIDLDHLLADPVFDPGRCSIGYHPLHSYFAIAVYVALLLFRKTRLLGLGLMIHIAADSADCLLLAMEAQGG